MKCNLLTNSCSAIIYRYRGNRRQPSPIGTTGSSFDLAGWLDKVNSRLVPFESVLDIFCFVHTHLLTCWTFVHPSAYHAGMIIGSSHGLMTETHTHRVLVSSSPCPSMYSFITRGACLHTDDVHTMRWSHMHDPRPPLTHTHTPSISIRPPRCCGIIALTTATRCQTWTRSRVRP
jgi:hypothetical protein